MPPHTPWQLVLIAWGEKYGAADINQLIRAARRLSPSLARVVLMTDRPRPGIEPGVVLTEFAGDLLRPEFMRSGCQAKLSMFSKGLIPEDMVAIYMDLDTLLLKDPARLLEAMERPQSLVLFQSAVIPFGPMGRFIRHITGGRHYARGNSSIVAYHPAHCHYIASEFRAAMKAHPDFSFRPMRADERFMSWAAQEHARRIPRSVAVKFPTEFMLPWLGLARLHSALPWVRARRAGLTAVTLPGEAVKPEVLRDLPDGALIQDHKGRKTLWSDRVLGAIRGKILNALHADQPW